MTYLFAALMAALFWGGYWLGWRDAKMQMETNAQIDRLFDLAKRGVAGPGNKEPSLLASSGDLPTDTSSPQGGRD